MLMTLSSLPHHQHCCIDSFRISATILSEGSGDYSSLSGSTCLACQRWQPPPLTTPVYD
jgi:anti-sigma factor ChrR (cupin superfamily)